MGVYYDCKRELFGDQENIRFQIKNDENKIENSNIKNCKNFKRKTQFLRNEQDSDISMENL